MKKNNYLPTFLVIMLMLLMMTACGKSKNDDAISDETKAVCGSWAYIHDKETAIAVFHKDGTAEYEDEDYTFECDSQYIKLKSSDGETKQLRYQLDDEGMYLFSNNTYTYSGEGVPTGLIGKWECKEKNWSYEFTESGTFLEDGFFPGYYTVDDQNSTFKLVYNDQFEDTVCYFSLEGDKLRIEYPWRMVKMSDKK
jgi:hypothetical protein